jgi:SpoVK/Ycf46/Vps4 family AAA+-type ATPase
MAGRQLKELFQAFHAHNELAFRRAAQEIIEEEQAKHHFALARDLERLLTAHGRGVDIGPAAILPEPPKDREGEWLLAEIHLPERTLDELVVSPQTDKLLRGLIKEVAHWQELDRSGVPRRQRILFQGPPGCGKTSAAEAVAEELGWPFVLVRLDAVVSSYLGETSSNIRRVLEYADHGQFVVLFDEFDSLGRSRDDSAEHGEMKRVVTAFLQMIDKYRGPSLLIAATNHPGLLDPALWRRFDEVVEFSHPTVHELRRLLRLRLRPVAHSGVDVEKLASALKGYPHAAAEKLVWDARRAAILAGRRNILSEDAVDALEGVLSRPW